MAPASLDFKNVIKRYGSVTAVDGISFRCEAGTLTTLLGPSGCGKTTTLRMIAGLELASEGQILIGGRDVTHLSAAERDVTMVFQSYALFPHMTVMENVMFGPRSSGFSKEKSAAMAREKLGLLGLSAFESRLPSELSGGQQQRVAVARALVLDPPLLLADEPTGNLDPGTAERVGDLLLRLNEARGTALVVVTHNAELARRMGRALVLRDGRLS
jgi:iron(III) transport system ATP-binding protein